MSLLKETFTISLALLFKSLSPLRALTPADLLPFTFLSISFSNDSINTLSSSHFWNNSDVSKLSIETLKVHLTIENEVVYNCLDPIIYNTKYREEFRLQHKISSNAIVIGTASRITKERGIAIFVEAAIQFLKNTAEN